MLMAAHVLLVVRVIGRKAASAETSKAAAARRGASMIGKVFMWIF